MICLYVLFPFSPLLFVSYNVLFIMSLLLVVFCVVVFVYVFMFCHHPRRHQGAAREVRAVESRAGGLSLFRPLRLPHFHFPEASF